MESAAGPQEGLTMTTNKFYEQMSERAKNITRINQYAAFLLRSILNEIYLKDKRGTVFANKSRANYPKMFIFPLILTDSTLRSALERERRLVVVSL